MKTTLLLLIPIIVLFFSATLCAQGTVESDPDFHIYLCFGQSNMEGNAAIAPSDYTGVDDRFQVMTVSPSDFDHLNRTVGNWYTAVPPLCRWDTGLTPADYFGRTMVEHQPDSIKVGVIVVAIGGSGIDAFDRDNYVQYYQNADAWQKSLMDIYGGNPYARLIEMAKQAQQSGVIKGILLHQGETNNGQSDWPLKVQKIYNNILEDLDIEPNSIPLLAGEMLHQDQGGICYGMNDIIATLPDYIPNSHVISSEGCPGTDDFHFTTEGARELGSRYGTQMLSLVKKYDTEEGQMVDYLSIPDPEITMQTGTSQKIPLTAFFKDGHFEDICYKAIYENSNAEVINISNGIMNSLIDGEANIIAKYTGALGEEKQISFKVTSTIFPLSNGLFNADIFGDGTFDENTHTLHTGQWGFGGWQFDGIDISGYNNIVVKLGSDNNADVQFKLFDGNSYWGSPATFSFGNSREIIVDLLNAKKEDGTPLNRNHIYIAGFWSNGNNPFIIESISLANSTGINNSGIEDVVNLNCLPDKVDVYTISGHKIRSLVKRENAVVGLPEGIYIVGVKKKYIKVIKSKI